ncbi:DUF1917-domain-containing protein [Lentithecium fluviatile CBS 122367]|uniref:DUF1917-domain-containing protein n=1 Tax=Lentithecium fluviatile CBS 122367 TaxID=1168545 RepID=A0A6G1JB12_9PLEO|nr:DUF1917-domain-containing protein [Lentithecium fluviatile CBS 122367]
MGEEEMLIGEGWISDDSSFYGDEDLQARLSSLCDEYSPSAYWAKHKANVNDIIAEANATTSLPAPELFNLGQGQSNFWQLGETAADFVKRLPPLSTSRTICEWIWVQNPYPQGRDISASSETVEFMSRGQSLLQRSLQIRNDIQAESASHAKATTSRTLNQESKRLQQRISDLAVETNVLTGKWMLFPELADLSRIWRLVVDGVINNRLGPAAKVAPDDGSPGSRLICVYTKDFRDKDDVLRVLQELVTMGVAGTGRPIYYKSDPYTLLDIYRETAAKYGLQASLYSSQNMLAEASLARMAATPQKKQSRLDRMLESHDPMDLD